MKHTTGHIVALTVFAATIALSAPDSVSAQRGGGVFGGSEGTRLWGQLDQRFDEVANTLSLTDSQKQLITIVVDDFRETNADALGRLAAMQREMRGMFGGGGRPDRQAIQQIAQKHGNPVQGLAPAFETFKEDVTAVLDSEQVASLTRMLAQRRRPGGR